MAELYLFNKEEILINIIPEEDFNNDLHVRELNSTWSFEFITSLQYLNDVSKSNKIGFYDRYGEFRLFKIIREPEVDYLNDEISVNCLNDCYEMSDQIIEDKRLTNGTALQALSKVLDGSNYEVGEVAELGNRTINFYDISRMEGLKNIISAYGGELDYRIEFDVEFKHISQKYVDIKSRLGQDTGLRFTYDLNLESVVRKDVSESHCTVLYGRGGAIESGDGYSRKIKFTDVEWTKPTNPIDKSIGQNYIEDLDAIAKYGRIEGIYENSDIEEPSELLQATYEALQECKNPKLSYEVNAKDLASQNDEYDHLIVCIGDSVILLDEEYDLNFESRIVGFEESIKEESSEMKWIIGNVQSSFSSDSGSSGQIIKPSTGNADIEIDDDKFPDTLPDVPIVEVEGLFGSVIISWTYESKSYYEYELYASQLKDFNPDSSNLIFRGKSSSFLHQVKPKETWHYRTRVINTHGRNTDFSSQVHASTLKIEDGTQYFEKAAIADALIGDLRLDRGWVGQLKGQHIDARELTVTDGNGKQTLAIDSFGRVSLDVTELTISSQEVMTRSKVDQVIHEAVEELDFGGRNILKYSNIKSNTGWSSNSHVIFSESDGYERSGCITVTRSDYTGTSRTGPSNSNVTKQGVIPKGTQLTLSGWVMIHSGEGIPELDVNNTSLFYRAYYADGSGSFQDVVNLQLTMTMEKNKWMRISGTGTAKVDLAYNRVDGVSNSHIGFYLGKNGKVSVSKIKLELGNVLSDYTEAPEDFESIIDAVNSELKQEITNSVAGLQDQNNELIERFDEAFSDNVLSSYEKVQLKDDLRTIDNQYESMKTMINEFNESSVNGQFTALTLRHQELHTFVDPLLSDLNTASEASNATIREMLYQYQLQYNITYVALQTMIENKLTTLTTIVNTTAQGVETAITKSNTALDGVQTIGKHFNFTDSGWVEIFATINDVPGRFKTRITDQRLSFLDNSVEVAYMSNQQLYITQAQILNSLQLGNIEQSKTAKGGLIYQWKG